MNGSDERVLSGHCLCGRVSYVVRGEPIGVGHCYCRTCQRLTGTGHSSGALFPASSIEVTGELREYSVESSPGIVDQKFFCPTCGSSVLARNGAAPDLLSLTLGTLDDVNALRPQLGIYAAQKPSWDVLDEGIRNLDGSAVGHVRLEA